MREEGERHLPLPGRTADVFRVCLGSTLPGTPPAYGVEVPPLWIQDPTEAPGRPRSAWTGETVSQSAQVLRCQSVGSAAERLAFSAPLSPQLFCLEDCLDVPTHGWLA